jgi:hypothetical protein
MQITPPVVTPEEWEDCVTAVDDAHIIKLAKWRGWTHATCYLLRDNRVIGLRNKCWCFPNTDPDGDIRSIHYRINPKLGEKASWRFDPPGVKIYPLVLGNVQKIATIGVFESQWDAISLLDKLCVDPFATRDWCFVATRGASHAKARARVLSVSLCLYLPAERRGRDTLDRRRA